MQLSDFFLHDCSVMLIFDFMPSGLWEMLHDLENPPDSSTIKTYMRMLLKGVEYLHEKGIMHRVGMVKYS